MVELAHTVTDPGTVVVHPLDALLANAAVVHSGFLDQVTAEAVAGIVETVDLVPRNKQIGYMLACPFTLLALQAFFISFSCLAFSLRSSSSSL